MPQPTREQEAAMGMWVALSILWYGLIYVSPWILSGIAHVVRFMCLDDLSAFIQGNSNYVEGLQGEGFWAFCMGTIHLILRDVRSIYRAFRPKSGQALGARNIKIQESIGAYVGVMLVYGLLIAYPVVHYFYLIPQYIYTALELHTSVNLATPIKQFSNALIPGENHGYWALCLTLILSVLHGPLVRARQNKADKRLAHLCAN